MTKMIQNDMAFPKHVGAVKTPNYRFSQLNVEFLYSWTTYISVTLLPHRSSFSFTFYFIA